MRRVNVDVLIALVLLGLCGVFFAESFAIRDDAFSLVSAALWPRVALVALTALSAAYLVQSLRAGWRRGGRVELGAWLAANRNVLACFAFYGLFLLSLRYLGLLLGGSLFVFATLTALGRRDARHLVLHLVIAVLAIGIMWAIFTFGLGVILPQGRILPRW